MKGGCGSSRARDTGAAPRVTVITEPAGTSKARRPSQKSTGAGPSGGPHVRVFSVNAATGATRLFNEFFAYDAGFRGGVNVAIANLDGVGSAEVVTAAGAGDRGITTTSATVDLPEKIARPWTYELEPRGELGLLVDTGSDVLVGAWAGPFVDLALAVAEGIADPAPYIQAVLGAQP